MRTFGLADNIIKDRSEINLRSLVSSIKALSDEIRLRIVNILYEQELCVCEMVDALKLPQSTISRHLAVLRNAGLVEDKKQGQWVVYRLLVRNEFIRILIENEMRSKPFFAKDIEALNTRLQKGRGLITCKAAQ